MSSTDSQSLAAASAGSAAFGSALSVNEFAALSGAGISPLGAVMGCDLQALYMNLPLPVRPTPVKRDPKRPYGSAVTYGRRYDGDVVAIGQLDAFVNDSRKRVLAHLRDEAAALGADAVVGIRQVPTPAAKGLWAELEGHHPGRHNLTLRTAGRSTTSLIGTAVRDPESNSPEPRLTMVSAVDFCKLREAGWRPVGIVGGCSHQFGSNVRAGLTATEIAGATALWETARASAFAQITAEMNALGAHGLIGLEVSDKHATYAAPAVLVSVNMIATAIERAPAHETKQSPMRIITLR